MIDYLHQPPAAAPARFADLLHSFVEPGVDPGETLAILADPDVAAYLAGERGRALSDWPDLARYAADNARLVASGDEVRAVFIGDSITEIWQHADPSLFPPGIVNRGIGGQTTPQILLRFYADVVALRPRQVHILAGINDINGNTGPNRPEDFRNNMRAMADIASANGIAVLFGSLLPTARCHMLPDARPAARVIELNGWLRAFCESRGLGFVDYFGALRDSRDGMAPAISNDGLHPNRTGYAIMSPLARAALML